MHILQFMLSQQNRMITLLFSDKSRISLTAEFLRVVPSTNNAGSKPLTAHKKNVAVLAIEPLDKHGYRIVFDDNSNIVFSVAQLYELAKNKDALWQAYLSQLAANNHSRESIIDIKQVN